MTDSGAVHCDVEWGVTLHKKPVSLIGAVRWRATSGARGLVRCKELSAPIYNRHANMLFASFILAVTLSVVVTLPDVLGAPVSENLTARAGEEITLQTGVTGLHGDYSVSWYWGTSKETLVHCDKGEIDISPPKRFKGRLHLDKTTGCLTIQDLSIEDNGIYQVDIIDGNNKKTVHHYTVTVSEAAGSSPDAAAAQKNDMAVVLTVLLSVAVCIELFT